jgi:hypothetical protein
MARFTVKNDYRVDPFTEVDQATSIVAEGLTIPAVSPFYVQLEEVPRLDDPSSVAIYNVTDALTMQEVSAAPASQEYQVDYPTPLGENPSPARYGTGMIRFNSAQASKTIQVSYKATGHLVRAKWFNEINDVSGGIPSAIALVDVADQTTSTGGAWIDAEGMTCSFYSYGGKAVLMADLSVLYGSGAATLDVQFMVDGVASGLETGLTISPDRASMHHGFVTGDLAGGTHTASLQYKVSSGGQPTTTRARRMMVLYNTL